MKPFTAANTTFSAGCDIVVTGSNPENADVCNPRGDYFGEAWMIFATNEHGDRRYIDVGMDAEGRAKADAFATVFGVRTSRLGKLPVGFAGWREARPEYGSDAYVEYGAADDIEWERKNEG